MSDPFPRHQRRLVCYDPAELEEMLLRAYRAGAVRSIDWLIAQHGDAGRKLVKPLRHVYGGWRP
jgi:hypothetical protein